MRLSSCPPLWWPRLLPSLFIHSFIYACKRDCIQLQQSREEKDTMLHFVPSVCSSDQSAAISCRNSCCTMHFAEIEHQKFLHKTLRGPFIKSFLQCDLQNSPRSPKPPLVCFEWFLQHFEKVVVLNVRVYIFFSIRLNQLFSACFFFKEWMFSAAAGPLLCAKLSGSMQQIVPFS